MKDVDFDYVLFSQQGSLGRVHQLFGDESKSISLHIRNIFKEGELVEESVVKDSLTTAADGKKYKVTSWYTVW